MSDSECQKLLDEITTEAKWSVLIKRRDMRCQYCGTEQSLQACHIAGRSITKWKWSIGNGITLCHTHHDLATNSNEQEEKIMRIAIKNKYGSDALWDYIQNYKYH